MQLAWLSELIKKEVSSQRGAEEIRMILLRKKTKNKHNEKKPTIKIKLKVLPENTGYLGRHKKDRRREKVISGTETAGTVLKI